MKLEMNLLENAYDFLDSSLYSAKIADEYGTHDQGLCDISNKSKWKVAYIELVQSMELLVKVALSQVCDALIYENIDNPIDKTKPPKTVSGSKGIDRLCNCRDDVFRTDERQFLKQCILLRNEYMHSIVMIDSIELKPKYGKLYTLFLKLNEYIGEKNNKLLKDVISKNQCVHDNMVWFSKKMIIFRNNEMYPEDKENLEKEIRLNKNMKYLIDKSGNKYKRIKYGDEEGNMKAEYCPDCLAAKGEYHLDSCDIERCPKCHWQLLSCNCDLELQSEVNRLPDDNT